MRTLFMGGISGILADEMGLDKTVQVIALLAHLIEKGVHGPHLVIAPLSTLANWKSEFERFAPAMPVIVFHGNPAERLLLQRKAFDKKHVGGMDLYPTLIISYHHVRSDLKFLQKIQWKYLVIDEAHRIKNHESQLALAARRLEIKNKLLLTGTPGSLQEKVCGNFKIERFIIKSA